MGYQVILFLKRGIAAPFCLTFLFSYVQAQSDDVTIIANLEKQRNYAITLDDQKGLSDLLDESFRGVTATGKIVHKSEQLTLYKSTNPFVKFASEDVSITSHGPTATVTGTLVSKSKSGTTMGKTRYLFIYLKKDDKWKIIASQETVVINDSVIR